MEESEVEGKWLRRAVEMLEGERARSGAAERQIAVKKTGVGPVRTVATSQIYFVVVHSESYVV